MRDSWYFEHDSFGGYTTDCKAVGGGSRRTCDGGGTGLVTEMEVRGFRVGRVSVMGWYENDGERTPTKDGCMSVLDGELREVTQDDVRHGGGGFYERKV